MAEANKPAQADSELGLMHDGHLSALAVQLLADLQLDGLPLELAEHAEHCADCSERVAEFALRALEVDQSIALQAEPQLALAHASERSLPWLPLSLGIAVATLASLPALGQWPARVGHWRLFLNGLERMVQPIWVALTSSTALFAATCAAVVLCFLVLVPLRRLSAGEVNG
jgi:hypothetical protein